MTKKNKNKKNLMRVKHSTVKTMYKNLVALLKIQLGTMKTKKVTEFPNKSIILTLISLNMSKSPGLPPR